MYRRVAPGPCATSLLPISWSRTPSLMHLVSHGWGMLSRSRFRRIGGVVDLRHAMRTAVLQQAPLRCALLAVSRSCCGFCRLYHELPITTTCTCGRDQNVVLENITAQSENGIFISGRVRGCLFGLQLHYVVNSRWMCSVDLSCLTKSISVVWSNHTQVKSWEV